MSKLRIMSQNQWSWSENTPYWEERGLDCSSEARMKGHARVFQELMPDIIGGQEVNKNMQPDLMFNCLEAGLAYTMIWGNLTPIIYRTDKFDLLDAEYILYPERVPEYEGIFCDSRSKSANLGVFRRKEDGKVFIFVTTHLWYKNGSDPTNRRYRAGSDQVRTMQLKMAMDLVTKYQKKYDNCPAIVVGDMNAVYHSEAIQCALNEYGYSHAHDVAVEYAHPGVGYNPCSHRMLGDWLDKPFEEAIDHVLVKDFPEGAVRRFDRYTPDYYLYLSDHAPVFVDIEL